MSAEYLKNSADSRPSASSAHLAALAFHRPASAISVLRRWRSSRFSCAASDSACFDLVSISSPAHTHDSYVPSWSARVAPAALAMRPRRGWSSAWFLREYHVVKDVEDQALARRTQAQASCHWPDLCHDVTPPVQEPVTSIILCAQSTIEAASQTCPYTNRNLFIMRF